MGAGDRWDWSRRFRYGRVDAQRSRIVLDLTRDSRIVSRMMLAPSNGNRHYRFVVDIAPGSTREPQQVTGAAPARNAKQQARRTEQPATATPTVRAEQPASREQPATQEPRERRPPPGSTPLPVVKPDPGPPAAPPSGSKPMIALDAGHGGIDPGAIAVNGVLEKNITLLMATELAAKLEATGRYDTVLTRPTDEFVRLRDRLDITREASADVLLSLHADSLSDRDFSGGSVYTLSEKASDEEAARLATRENKADIIGGTDLSHHDEVVTSILIDLAQRDTNNKSIDLAELLIEELGEVIKLVRNTRRYAGFVVLKSPDTPSVLVELGYLSNEKDAANLMRPEHRARLTDAILEAIERYFAEPRQAL